MRSRTFTLPKTARTLDAALVGTWQAPDGALIEIAADGTLFSIEPALVYTLSADDQTLTFPNTNPLWQFTRLSGSGSIVGLWERFETDAYGTWREETLYRSDGTYTYHWMLNGAFDSEGIGTWVDLGGTLNSRERRGIFVTGPGSDILLSVFFGAPVLGSYSVAADGQSWTLTTSGGSATYTRV
ncbi:hypothetical protein [Pacificoceanicola onchidii]|uniref:hypothetical protein n=1 Tax=Pacificoceanicola onchidii TaxID=2562685 RepID=UPI0010A55468|nr:hypothetical protein [Pacificoceanicola onchidii]